MQQANITDNDLIFFDVLKYKKIGDEINKLEFHLNMAAKSFKIIKDTCKDIENETGIKMNFVSD
jgi:hypothetical protein